MIASGQSFIISSRRDKRDFNYVQLFKSTLPYSSLIRQRNYISLNGARSVQKAHHANEYTFMLMTIIWWWRRMRDFCAPPLTVAAFQLTFTITSHNDLPYQTKKLYYWKIESRILHNKISDSIACSCLCQTANESNKKFVMNHDTRRAVSKCHEYSSVIASSSHWMRSSVK